MTVKHTHIALAAGGTGGHFFPAISTAENLIKAGHSVTIYTDARSAKYASAEHLENIKIIPLINRSFSGNMLHKLISCFFLGIGFCQALWLLMRHRPAKMIGFGGYPSFPGIFASIILRIPVILHDQNTILGRVNKILGRFASKIAVSYPIDVITKLNPLSQAMRAKLIYTGSPIRQAFQDNFNITTLTKTGKIQLFIFGGSQGARIFSTEIPKHIAALPSALKKRLQITQQARIEDIPALTALYKQEKITAEIKPFFTNMAEILPHSHLVVARSGASSIAELLATQTPAIYIPLPSSKDNHQFYNAQYVSDTLKAGWLVEQKELRAPILEQCLTDIKTYTAMRKNLKKLRLADHLLTLI